MMIEDTERWTTVRLPVTLRERLKVLGHKQDSYADIIRMLYEDYMSKGGRSKKK